jgi:Rod binding domain-containing protein
MSESLGIPPIDQSLLPASVRNGGQKDVQLYDQALGFEGMLDQQIAKALTDTLKPVGDSDSGDDSDGGDATTNMLSQLLPQALSQGLVANGGVGVANQIYQSLSGSKP